MITYRGVLEQNPWWQEKFQPEESALPRRDCFDSVRKGLELPFAQVLLGIRRVGKSTLIRQVIADLLEQGVNPRYILYFSFDRYAVEKTPEALEMVLKLFFERTIRKPLHQIQSPCYLFIDEVQYIDYWADIVKRFYDQSKQLKFVLTGSQSTKLQGSSQGSLAGRVLEYHLPPLSYSEYCRITDVVTPSFLPVFELAERDWISEIEEFEFRDGKGICRDIPSYLSYGQFPEVAGSIDINLSHRYICESVLGKILASDLPGHYGIENMEAFKVMANHLITNSGSLFELNNIGSDLGIAKATTEKYLGYLCESTLISVVHNRTGSEIKKGRSLKKAYAGAPCFICAINKYPLDLWETAPEVFGKVVESYVWWRLSAQFEKVAFWRSRQEEVDFILFNSKGVEIPVEVKFTSRIRSNDLKVLVRYMERRGLDLGYVLTRDRIDEFTVDGKRLRLMPYYMLS